MSSPNTPTDIEIAVKRELLLHFLGRQAETGKWLLGSLLVVNGGAIAGLLSSERIEPIALAISGRYFVSGVGLAFASGIFSHSVSDGWIAILRRQLRIQISSADGNITDRSMEIITISVSVLAFLALVGSLVMFVLGALAVSSSITAAPTKPSVNAASHGSKPSGLKTAK